jgi:hypothetical protein
VSEPDGAPVPAAQIDAAISALDRRLRRLHIGRDDRRALVDDVRSDLRAAAADGVTPEELIGPDIGAFAREAVEAAGYRSRPHDLSRVLTGGALAGVVAVVAGYLLIVGVLQPALASWFTLDGRYPSAGPVVVYGAVALLGVVGLLAALKWWVLAGRPAVRATVLRAAVLLPVVAAAGIAGAVAVARDPAYTVTAGTIVVQVLLVAVPVLAAVGLARYWAVRSSTADRGADARTAGPAAAGMGRGTGHRLD